MSSVLTAVYRAYRRLVPKWIVLPTIWPFPEGYGVCSRDRRTILETGLSLKKANAIAEEMNKGGSQ